MYRQVIQEIQVLRRLDWSKGRHSSTGYLLSDGTADIREPSGFLHTARMGRIRVSNAGH